MMEQQELSQVQLFDIYDYAYPPFWQTPKFYLFLVLFLVFCGIMSYVLWQKRKNKKISPEEWALDQLAQIASKSYQTRKEFQQLYINLTRTIKQYLAKRFGWKTVDKTDEELLTLLEEKQFNQELLDKLRVTLSGASRIKFSHEQALAQQSIVDIQTAQDLVNFIISTLAQKQP